MRGHRVVYSIDPDAAISEGLSALFDAYGVNVEAYDCAERFLEMLDDIADDDVVVLLTEAQLPGMNGIRLVKRLREEGRRMPIVVLTSTVNEALARRARQAGANDVIEKPMIDAFLLEGLQARL